MSGQGHICREPNAICSDCGKYRELRPYGKNFAKVCFECARKDPQAMKKGADRLLFGTGETWNG